MSESRLPVGYWRKRFDEVSADIATAEDSRTLTRKLDLAALLKYREWLRGMGGLGHGVEEEEAVRA